jgi:hypothetical protein
MPELETRFHKMLNDTGYFHFRNYSALYIPIHKFTIELIFNNREIPDKYIIPENQILHQFPKIYKKLTERGQITTIDRMLELNRNNHEDHNIDFVAQGAAKTGNMKLLRRLYQEDYRFKFSTTCAAVKAGNLKTLKWLVNHGAQVTDLTINTAIKKGCMKMLKYVVPLSKCRGDEIFLAASCGHLKMIKFLHSVAYVPLKQVISGAAHGGHIKILKFGLEHGCEINATSFTCNHLHILQWLVENQDFKYAPGIFEHMALHGKLDCLQYMHSNGYDILTPKVFMAAIRSRNIKLIHWLRNIYTDKTHFWTIYAAVDMSSNKHDQHGSLTILQLLVSWGYNLSDTDPTIPARNGDLHILQYLIIHGCKLSENVINAAAEYGHLHIIIWCRQQGCNWSADTCGRTVRWNHLHVLKWLRGFDRKGSDETEICPWDARVCIEAINYNHIDVLSFALDNGCHLDEECYKAMTASRNLAIIDLVNDYYKQLRGRLLIKMIGQEHKTESTVL